MEKSSMNSSLLLLSGSVACGIAIGILISSQSKRPKLQKTSVHFLQRPSKKTEPEPERFNDGQEEEHVVFNYEPATGEEMLDRAKAMYEIMSERRSLRFFSDEKVDHAIVEKCVAAAATAPSGAHCQPWTFCIVSSMDKKKAIRAAVEAEEKINYERRMNRKWVADVLHFSHNLPAPYIKPYLTEAPHLIVMFKRTVADDDEPTSIYYANESCGIAAGILISALHYAKLVTLTSTPMGADKEIRQILDRPQHEKVYLLLPVGIPTKDATVPYRKNLRKPLEDICVSY